MGKLKRFFSNPSQLIIGLSIAATCVVSLITDIRFEDLVPLIVSLIAGFVAISINETVSSRRRADMAAKLREQREQVYRDLIDHMLQSFQGGPEKSEWEVRTQIALWGSKSLLSEYSNWRTAIGKVMNAGTSVEIPEAEKRPLQEAVARVCLASRVDLEITVKQEPTVPELSRIFFDDYNE